MIEKRQADAFTGHHHTFVDVGDDAAVGVEEPFVIDDDRGLADLAHVVERLGHRAVAGFLAFDDLDKRHLLDGREEVDADELIRTHRGLGQIGDRQGRGIGGKDRIRRNDRLDLFGHLGLDAGIFEHRLDDEVDVLEGLKIGGGVDLGQKRLFLLRGRFLAGDALVHEAFRVGLAAVGGFLRLVDEDHVHTGLGRDERDTGTHHARTKNTNLFNALIGHVGAVGAFFKRFLVEE